jgi:hypothetical protein
MGFINQLITGGHHPVWICFFDKHDHGKSTTKICTDSLHIMFPFKIGFAGQPCFITRVRVSYVSHQPVESPPMYLSTLSRAHNDLTLDWVRLVMVIPKCYPKLNGPKNIQNSIFTCRSDQLHWCLVGKGMIHNIYIYIYIHISHHSIINYYNVGPSSYKRGYKPQ